MLKEIYPRFHLRYSSLPLLGPHLNGFVSWLRKHGYADFRIRLRIRKMPLIVAMLDRRRIRRFDKVTAAEFMKLAPTNSQDDVYLTAAVRSFTQYLVDLKGFALPEETPSKKALALYLAHLKRTCGLAESTLAAHSATITELLKLVNLDSDATALRKLGLQQVEESIRMLGARLSRASLQHSVAHLRSFLRFLASRGEIRQGLDTSIDTPRLFRGERLPRALSWHTVQDFLSAIDRSTPMGRRDYAMFLLIATYGLRTCEVSALRLDDIAWQASRISVPRPKTRCSLDLPLTDEVGAAILDYLQHGRPNVAWREVFLRVRAPEGPLKPTAVTEVFQNWTRRSGLSIPHQGPHCLRHSLAMHLLRQGASIKEIGDLLGHRSIESTGVYLRLHVPDLRDAALDLPQEEQS